MIAFGFSETYALQVLAVEEQAARFQANSTARIVLYVWDGTDTVLSGAEHTYVHLRTRVRAVCQPDSLRARSLPANGSGTDAAPRCMSTGAHGSNIWAVDELPSTGSIVPLLLLGLDCEVGMVPAIQDHEPRLRKTSACAISSCSKCLHLVVTLWA